MVHGHTAQAAHDALREVRVLLGHVLEVEELDGQLPESSPENALFRSRRPENPSLLTELVRSDRCELLLKLLRQLLGPGAQRLT